MFFLEKGRIGICCHFFFVQKRFENVQESAKRGRRGKGGGKGTPKKTEVYGVNRQIFSAYLLCLFGLILNSPLFPSFLLLW